VTVPASPTGRRCGELAARRDRQHLGVGQAGLLDRLYHSDRTIGKVFTPAKEVRSPLSYCPRSSLPAKVLAWLAGRLAHLLPPRPPGGGQPAQAADAQGAGHVPSSRGRRPTPPTAGAGFAGRGGWAASVSATARPGPVSR
jgi:hypothetical protein